ncbi:MAG: TolC family protein [Desulfuromonadales bacterium]|nr:TolC family protein [Desulfuromonadales bacterium]
MKFHRANLVVGVGILFLLATNSWGAQLTLNDCLQKARDNHPGLRTAAWDTRIAEQNVRQTSSAWYPRLDAQAGYTVQQAPQAAIIQGKIAEVQDADYAFGGIAVNYTLYDFGKREARIKHARSLADATSNTFEARRTDVSLQVIETYFGILETDKLVIAAREEITQVEQHRRMAQALFEEGVVTRNDILQAEVRLAAARQNLLATANQRENIWLRLNYLTGSAPSFRADLTEDSSPLDSSRSPADVNGALTRRPEILALRQGAAASQAEVQESRAAYFPELFTRLALDYVENSKYREQTIMSATVGLRINLFDGFATTAARDKALHSQSRSLDQLRQAEAQVRLEIDTAGNDLRVAGERISVAESAIRQSEENLRINRERYQERVGTATEVLDAQTLLTQTRTDYYRALFDRQVAAARLKRALGEL